MTNISEHPLNIPETRAKFLDAILKPDLTQALAICHNFIISNADISLFWEDIIKPCLYEVGLKWERGEIVHQQEHLATSICSKVINEYDPHVYSLRNANKKVLITCSQFEKHTVGLRMLNQLLKLNGIESRLLLHVDIHGKEIIKEVETERFDAILFSTTMYDNLINTEHLIQNVKAGLNNTPPFCISGGQAFKNIQVNAAQMIQSMFGRYHADLYMFTAAQLITFLNEETASL